MQQQLHTLHQHIEEVDHQLLEKDEEVIEANMQQYHAYVLANQSTNQLDHAQAMIQELLQQQPPQEVEEEPAEVEEEPKEEEIKEIEEDVEEEEVEPEEIEGVSRLDFEKFPDQHVD